MAVELLAASNEYYHRSASLSGDVFTFAAWVYITDLTADRAIISAGDEGTTGNNYFQLRYDQSSNDLRFVTRDATTNGIALSTITPATNTWYHVVGSISGLSSRSVWINGGNKGTNTTTLTSWSSTVDNIAVGIYIDAGTPRQDFNGRIFMPAVWQGWAAGDDDTAAMAAGVPPWRFAPDKLIFYTPLATADTPRDWISGTALTVNGTPTTAESPHVMSDGGVLIPRVETIWDVTPSASTRASGSLSATDPAETPSMTTAQNGSMGIAVFLRDAGRTWSNPTQSYTNEVQASPAEQTLAMWSKQLPTAGLQSGVQATLSGAADEPWVAHQFALAPWGGGDVEFVAGASASNASALSLSVNKPTGAQEGDYLIVVVHHNSVNTINDNESGYPFDEDFQEAAPVATSQYAIFSRLLTASEPTSYQFTSTGAASRVQISAAAFRSAAPPPSITDVANSGETPGAGSETWDDGSTGNVITGANFL